MMLEPFEEKMQMKIFYMCLFLAGALFILYLSGIDFGQWLPGCFLYEKYHLYCPGCGGTRAVRLLFTGHIWKSFLYHPGVLFAAVLYLWFMVSQTIERFSNGKLKVGLPYSDKFLYWEMAVILLQCLIKNLVKISLGIGIL